MKTLATVLLLASFGCAPYTRVPPTLSTAAQRAFRNTQIIKTLDLIRDVAIAASDQSPPLVSVDTTRNVVLFHQAALKMIQASDAGAASSIWKAAILTALDETMKLLPEKERPVLAPYAALIRSTLANLVATMDGVECETVASVEHCFSFVKVAR